MTSSSKSPQYCDCFPRLCCCVSYVASIGFILCIYDHVVVCLHYVLFLITQCVHISRLAKSPKWPNHRLKFSTSKEGKLIALASSAFQTWKTNYTWSDFCCHPNAKSLVLAIPKIMDLPLKLVNDQLFQSMFCNPLNEHKNIPLDIQQDIHMSSKIYEQMVVGTICLNFLLINSY